MEGHKINIKDIKDESIANLMREFIKNGIEKAYISGSIFIDWDEPLSDDILTILCDWIAVLKDDVNNYTEYHFGDDAYVISENGMPFMFYWENADCEHMYKKVKTLEELKQLLVICK